jgi:prevent-host-death family protein
MLLHHADAYADLRTEGELSLVDDKVPAEESGIAMMTIYDYVRTMKKPPEKSVKVAELKAQLSAYLRSARSGQSVVVCDRDTPVARLVPYAAAAEPLAVRHAIRALHSAPLPRPLGRRVDSLAALLAERQSSR